MMRLNNAPKFIILVIALVGMLALVAAQRIAWSDASAPLGLIIGYGVGNGIAASRGQTNEPVFSPGTKGDALP